MITYLIEIGGNSKLHSIQNRFFIPHVSLIHIFSVKCNPNPIQNQPFLILKD